MLREIVHIKMEGPEEECDLPECVFDEWMACSDENRTNLIDFLMASEHQSQRRAGDMLQAIITSEEAEVAWLADAERGSTYDVLDRFVAKSKKAYPTDDDGSQKTTLAAKAVLKWMGEDESDPPQEVGDTVDALSKQLRDSLLKAFPSKKVPAAILKQIHISTNNKFKSLPNVRLPCGHSVIYMTKTGCSACKLSGPPRNL